MGERWGREARRGVVALAALVVVVGCTAVSDAPAGAPTADTAVPRVTPSTTEGVDHGAPPTAPSSSTTAPPETTANLPTGRDVAVTSITDGDTFRAGDERVRLTGIDTPEVSGGVECFGQEASAALERLIPVGTEVRLVLDVEPEDRYDRTLAYVYRVSDGLHVNLQMADDGYATPLTIPPNVAHEREFADAAAAAREADRGLWSACEDTVPTTSTPDRAPGGAGCDPSYPDVCIPPAPPDLDCGDIPFRRFTVLAPDPHRFDGGGDGLGCESVSS